MFFNGLDVPPECGIPFRYADRFAGMTGVSVSRT